MNLERARKIAVDFQQQQWDTARLREITFLAEQAQHSKLIVEVGSWLGCTARVMADNTDGIVYAVDTWQGGTDVSSVAQLQAGPADWVFEAFKANTADLTNLRIVRLDSLEAAEMFRTAGVAFDLIFIDASHDYESVKADILAWRPLLAPGGVLCGHDFDPYGAPGVVRAVKELVPAWRIAAAAIWRTA